MLDRDRIKTLEAALREIMAIVRDEEWDKAPPHIYDIAQRALIAAGKSPP